MSTIISFLLFPLGMVIVLLSAAILLDLFRRRWSLSTTAIALALAVILVSSNEAVAKHLVYPLERQYPSLEGDNIEAEAIVVIGGGIRPEVYPRQLPEFAEGGDRILYAADLYERGYAPLIVTSGNYFSHYMQADGISEAGEMARLLLRWGVPEEAIMIEDRSLNTYENGIETKRLLEEKEINRIILVTSAFHMPRSVAVFEKQGFEVIAAPSDFHVTRGRVQSTRFPWPRDINDYTPHVSYLELTTTAIKEYVGMLYYRLRGWA